MCKWEWKKISTLVTKCQNIKWDNVPLDDSRLYIDLSSVNKDTQCIEDVSEVNVENAPSRAKQIIHENDVLFATTRPTQKRVCIVERQYDNQICSTGFCVLRPLDCLESKYLFYCLLSDDFYSYIKPLEKGANYPAVTDGDVKNYEIPVPPLSEQKRIVKFLDEEFSKIDTLKTNAETNLKNAKELFETTLEKELNPLSRHSERSEESSAELPSGWELKTLQEISNVYGEYGLSVPSTSYNGIRYLRITDITDDGRLNDEYVSADIEKIEESDKLQEGDILFARTGATVGKTLIFKEDYGCCVFAGYLIRYRPKKEVVLPFYLHYVTHSKYYFDWVKKSQKAAAQPNISAKLYNAFQIPLPPLSVQKEIVARLDKLSENVKRLEANYKQITADCDELKKSILKKTFEGDSRLSRK